jgi:DNA-binding NarL/FixJ family response regulator
MYIDYPWASYLAANRLVSVGSSPLSVWTTAMLAGFACILVLAAAGFLLLGQRIQRLAAQVYGREKNAASLASELEAQALLYRQMSQDLEELRKHVGGQHGAMPPAPPVWAATDVPVNLNRRGQILRLSRKGKSVAEIASDLHVAQGEVELLLKLHDLSQRTSEPDKS